MSEIFDSAIIEFNLGNYKKALVLFDQTLTKEPHHVMALIKKGNILGKFAKYTDAITCYDGALGVEPQNRLALINKGLALHYLQRYDDAIVCYDAILEKARQCNHPIQQGIQPSKKGGNKTWFGDFTGSN